jgi:hypothetical protein
MVTRRRSRERAVVPLDIWHDQTPKDDDGSVVIRVKTAVELDEVNDRVIDETAEYVAPPMIQVAIAGVKRSPAPQVGLGKDRGFIGCAARTEGGWTVGDGDPDAVAGCIYKGNHSEVSASAEVQMTVGCRGLHEFLATGGLLSVVESGVV